MFSEFGFFSVAASVSGPTVAPYFGSGLSVSVTQCCGVGWSDLALFSSFEGLHISVDQVNF